MLKIFHNPRCGKSRSGLAIVESANVPFEIVKYLEHPPTKDELQSIVNKLGIKPIELIRTKESIWIEHYKNQNLTDNELIAIMVQNPILIERPIVISANKAVLGRPPEKIEEFLKLL